MIVTFLPPFFPYLATGGKILHLAETMAGSNNAKEADFQFKCKLIEEIQHRTCLYDKANIKFHDRDEKGAEWQDVSLACGRDGM